MNNTNDIVTDWLKELSGGEEFFEYRDDGVYTFNLEEEIEVSVVIPLGQDLVCLHAPIVAIPEEEADCFALYAEALRMNLLTARTRGATLALNDRSHQLVLGYSTPVVGMDILAFTNVISGFIDTVKTVREELRAAGTGAVSLAEPAGPATWMRA